MSFDSDLASSLRGNQELIEDLCRYSEGILTEKQVRQKWHLANNEVWTSLGADDFVERVELERTRRIRSCATKRELAQLHIVRGPDILNTIMTDPRANAKHKVDAIKTLDALADPGPSRFEQDQDRIIIRIDLGADTRAKGQEPNPDDVLIFDAAVKPSPAAVDGKIIDGTFDAPKQIAAEQEMPLVKRSPERPKLSPNRNKSKTESHPKGVPGFVIDCH